jgi:hypothetical protein
VPAGRETFSLVIRDLGVDDGVLAVFGQPGDGFGLMFFASQADHRAFVDAGGVAAGRLGAPWHMAVHFERGADVLVPMRKEIAEHGWDVADPHAYPWIVVSDANHEQRRSP